MEDNKQDYEYGPDSQLYNGVPKGKVIRRRGRIAAFILGLKELIGFMYLLNMMAVILQM